MEKLNEIFSSPKKIKKLLQQNGLAFNKNLGQNFLINEFIVNKIVNSAQVENCGVLEVGAGLGVLTSKLVNCAKKVVALELDGGLFKILKQNFATIKNLKLLNCDVLKINLKELLNLNFDGLPVKICANLPYYLTSNFVANVLELKLNVESLTLMVQKEAAVRICAMPASSNCSAISYLINYYSQPKILFDVSKHNFFPVPKVNSCVINLKIFKNKNINLKINEKSFFKFIRVAFSQRRKIMISPISKFYGIDKSILKKHFIKLGLNLNVRAQQLNLEQFQNLFKLFENIVQK